MSSANSTFRAILAAATAFGSFAIAGGALAQAIVVRSTGPSAGAYPQGKKLPAGARVDLKAGDKITVIDKAGSRVLSGPGNFALDGTVNRTGGSVVAMIGGGGARARTGAVRGAPVGLEAPTAPDNIWAVDVTKGGTYCVADPAGLVLWRPNRADAIAGKLGANGKTVPVAWKAGSAVKLWPSADLPVVDGQTYVFTGPVMVNSTITLKKLASVPADPMGVAAALAEKGCTAQLDVIANQATTQ